MGKYLIRTSSLTKDSYFNKKKVLLTSLGSWYFNLLMFRSFTWLPFQQGSTWKFQDLFPDIFISTKIKYFWSSWALGFTRSSSVWTISELVELRAGGNKCNMLIFPSKRSGILLSYNFYFLYSSSLAARWSPFAVTRSIKLPNTSSHYQTPLPTAFLRKHHKSAF